MKHKIIAILRDSGFEADKLYTGRALVDLDYTIILEMHGDKTASMPPTHSDRSEWLHTPAIPEEDENIIAKVERKPRDIFRRRENDNSRKSRWSDCFFNGRG